MRLLLDTHIAVWAVDGDRRLSAKAKTLLDDRAHALFVSAISLWEIAIKSPLERGSNRMPMTAAQASADFVQAGFVLVSFSTAHAVRVADLPPHDGDPFDRALVAQALAEPYRLVTHYRQLTAYSDTVILV